MANNIKGITIKIGADTVALEDALKGVRTEAQNTQDELREINRALKLDPGNTGVLKQKQEALRKAVEATAHELKILKEAQEQAVGALSRKEIGQEQYDALTREIVLTEAALKKAKKAQADFNVEAEKAKVKLGEVSKKAQEVADKTKVLSAAAAGLLVAIGGAAVKSAAWADDLNTLSKQTGLTTEELQKMQYASELVDVSVDDIAGSMSKMRKAMAEDGKADVFARLGVSARDTNGQLRDSSTVFYVVLEGLGKVGNETERDTLAMEIFGRSADQLAGIIDDGGASLKELGAEAEKLGLILDQDTLDAMNKVNDQLDRLKGQAQASFAKAGASALEALSPLIEKIVTALSWLMEVIGDLNPAVIEAIAIIAAIVASVSTVAGIIAKVTALLPLLGAAMAALPYVAIIAGAIALYKALVALAEFIMHNWDNIKQKFDDAKNFVLGIFESILNAAKTRINAVIYFVNQGIEAVNKLISKLNNSALGKFFRLNVGSIGTIPELAVGGSLSSGTALVGERGPELLTMSNGRANVQPLQNTTNTYNTINQTSRQPVQINLTVDGMTLARAMYDPLKRVGNQRGPSFVAE